MNVFLLYLLLLKATLTSFSGLASLPVIHHDLVVEHKVLTEHQLNTALAAGRMGPGPLGLWVVAVGYYVAGIPGAVAGWLAMMTPAFLVIPILRYVGARADRASVRRVIRAVTLAGAGLILVSTASLAPEALRNLFFVAVAAASFAVLVLTQIDTAWVILGSAAAGLAAAVVVARFQ